MDDHVSRILKMLEDGKISATDAEKLLAALKPAQGAGASGGAASGAAPFGQAPDSGARSAGGAAAEPQDKGKSKSFEFEWSQRRSFPFDLSGLGKQISDAVKRIDPERLVKEARTGFTRGGKRFNERFKGFAGFAWFKDGDDGRPENVMSLPTARAEDALQFDLSPGASVVVENPCGSIAVFGDSESVRLEYSKEAWAPTETEAAVKLNDLQVEAGVHAPEGGTQRLEVRVVAPEDWRDGTVDLRLHVPETIAVKLSAVFGDVRVEGTSGAVEAHSISGTVALEELKGEARAESISGSISARSIGGALNLATKSGDVSAHGLKRGGSLVGVSGDVKVSSVEGGRLEAKSVSGDVTVHEAGLESPIDMKAESISGDLNISRARGSLTLKTVSGDISGERLDATTLQAETVSGDVRASLDTAFSGTLATNTVSGDVTVETPSGSHFRFTIATQSGELHCAHEVRDSSRTDTLWSGTAGTGAGTVHIQTRSGDVFLHRTE